MTTLLIPLLTNLDIINSAVEYETATSLQQKYYLDIITDDVVL